MSDGEHEKSVLKSVAIFLAFGLGYTSILHSVAAVYVLSIMYVLKLNADCVVCRSGERSTVNTTVNIYYTMYNIARCQLVLGSPKTAARAVFDAIVL